MHDQPSSKLVSVIRYLAKNYPFPSELSKARITKMVYLSDWVHSVWFRRQITDVKWYFNNFGPYVSDIENSARTDVFLDVVSDTNMFGKPKETIRLKPDAVPVISLDASEEKAVAHVIETTKSLYWDGFIKTVYNTYPVKHGSRYTELDLVSCAEKYRAEHQN